MQRADAVRLHVPLRPIRLDGLHVRSTRKFDRGSRFGHPHQDPPDWAPTSERSAEADPCQLALAQTDNQSPISTPPDAFSKVRTLVDFLAGRFASEPEWGSGASVDHAVAISCELHSSAILTMSHGPPLMISLAVSGALAD